MIAVVALIGAAICLFPAMAAADDVSSMPPAERTQLQAQKEMLFQKMLRDPANLDVTFAYANVSARLGDNEAAVSALERMLLFNSNLPRVDLELGALYFRMGSFDVAGDYFNKALAAHPPPDVTARVAEYQAQIAKAESRSHLSGSLMVGAMYQSDANVAPGSALIHSPIGDLLLGNAFVKKPDGAIFATGSLLYSYDLGTQNRDALEVTGAGFVDHYFQVDRLDLDLGEVTAGPRFNFPDPGVTWLKAGSIKPYLILNEVGLGESQYFSTYGAGIEGAVVTWNDVTLKSTFEFRQKNFSDAPDRPLSRGLNGNDKVISLSATKPITSNSTLSLQFDFLDQSTRFAFYANKAYALTGAYRIRYQDPTGWRPFPWETTAFVSRTWDNYASPDPCCNTSGSTIFFSASDRYDRRWRFGITQTFEVTDNAAIILQLQRDIVSSNLSLYGYTSNTVLIGPQIHF